MGSRKPRRLRPSKSMNSSASMNVRTIFFATLILLASSATAFAVPEWSGLFVLTDTARFALADPETNATSGWLTIGDSFEGYTLKAYQPESETLVLEKDGHEVALQLRTSRIKESTIAFAGTIHLGAADDLEVRKATLAYGQESTFPLAPGVTLTLKATKQPDGTISYGARFERTGANGSKEVLSAPTVIARPGDPFSVMVDDLSFFLHP
jgi:hypothetical protein